MPCQAISYFLSHILFEFEIVGQLIWYPMRSLEVDTLISQIILGVRSLGTNNSFMTSDVDVRSLGKQCHISYFTIHLETRSFGRPCHISSLISSWNEIFGQTFSHLVSHFELRSPGRHPYIFHLILVCNLLTDNLTSQIADFTFMQDCWADDVISHV